MRYERTRSGGHAAIYEIVEAAEHLIATIRRTGLGEKIASEPHLRAMWDDTDGPERVLLSAIVNALEIPNRIPRPYRVGFAARVLKAIESGLSSAEAIARSFDDEPYSLRLKDNVYNTFYRLKTQGLVETDESGRYIIAPPAPPKPRHPWSQRAVLPKRSP